MKKTTNLVWGGRFEYDSSDILKRINNSISFDYNLAHQDIKLNKQYAKSLFKAKNTIISSYGFDIFDKGDKIIFYGKSFVVLK